MDILRYLAACLLRSFYLKKNLLIPVPRDNRWLIDYLQLLNEYDELVSPRMNRDILIKNVAKTFFSRSRRKQIIFLNRIICNYQKEFSSEIEEYLEYLQHEYEELLSLHFWNENHRRRVIFLIREIYLGEENFIFL
ncbi:unnamed protein product [Rhizophagus irregularis]|uniref:Uncharacterized protein n=1 Tax=Rhizophagus irregularis TaxID=588596 RepID=A0A916E3F1_9GLOM|nr:unnamed protein product [Rhizophagus irregularis]CAB5207586.1 unnamed protein product [Rhizophagus irregularis]CAB5355807.1 unnamed protein product [Rhizophagus irregularis]